MPLPKAGNSVVKHSSYYPIGLFLSLSQLGEIRISPLLSSALDEHYMLKDWQHCFEYSLHLVTDVWNHLRSERFSHVPGLAMFLDAPGAFNLVCHKVILLYFSDSNVPDWLLSSFYSYLDGRSFTFLFEGSCSSWGQNCPRIPRAVIGALRSSTCT